jgi:hypothetical protein
MDLGCCIGCAPFLFSRHLYFEAEKNEIRIVKEIEGVLTTTVVVLTSLVVKRTIWR